MLKKIKKRPSKGSLKAAADVAKAGSGADTTTDSTAPSASDAIKAADTDSIENSGIVPLDREAIPSKVELLEATPSFRDVGSSERQDLFIRKLQLCCVTFNFNDLMNPDNLGKEMKRQLLLELVDFISTTKKWFSEEVLRAFIRMVSINLFRPFPPSPNENVNDPDEDEPVLDPAWPHLQIVYEFLLRFVVSTATDTKLMKVYINDRFVFQLLELFKSDDPRERDYLKTILHRVYGRFMSLRLVIRKAIHNVFYEFIYDTERHAGVGEILEIMGSIINGFALPLKEEHKDFMKNVLIPLHKPKALPQYHQQLSYCITQFVDKDPKLAPDVIRGLINFWPIVNSSKEVMFLNEVEEVIDLTQPEQIKEVAAALFHQIARSISSKHFQVAERALYLWNNEYFAGIATDNRKVILPILYPALNQNTKQHWNQTVHSLTFNIVRLFMDTDNVLFEKVAKAHADKYGDPDKVKQERSDRWNAIREAAKQNRGTA